MFTVFKAQTTQLAAEEVISHIAGEGRHIVIAPDPFTLAVEKTISAKLNKKGFFDVEVMSFARLASVFAKEEAENCLSPAGSVMLMEKVIRQEEKNLIHYQKAAGKPGFAAELYAAVTSVRNSGVTPQILQGIEGKLKGYVKSKTHDIAHLYDAYLTELKINHSDSTTRLEALAEHIRESEDFGDISFYVVDHVDLNAKQIEIVSALMKKARAVTVAVADGEGASNHRIYPSLLTRLRSAAARAGVKVNEVAVSSSSVPAVKRRLADEMFSYSFTEEQADGFFLFEAKDKTEEVTLLATEIVRLVRKEGFRYSDVAVISPSFEEYLPVFTRLFRAYDIPFFADRRVPLSSTDLFRHLMLAMEVSLRGYDRTLARKYVLHALFEGAEEEKAAFSDYLYISGADHDFLKKKFDLFEDHPLYPAAEKLREAFCREIGVFDRFVKAPATVKEYAAAVDAFLLQNDFDKKVEDYLKKVNDAGLKEQAEVLRQVPAAIRELLDVLVELRGEEVIDFKDFVLTLTAGAGQVKIASLPVSLDCVYFAPVKQAMYAPIPALFVLGAEEGLFPLESVGEGILGTAEYRAWQENEVVIENTGNEELEQSRFHALQLLLRGERTYLSHVESQNASPCFLQIKNLFVTPVVKCADALKQYDADVLIPTKQVARLALVEYSRRYHEGLLSEKERVVAQAVANVLGVSFPLTQIDEEISSVDGSLFFTEGVTSVSQLETYFNCPFLHFVQYGLKAEEKQKVAFDIRDTGIIVHKCMQRFVKKLRDKNYKMGEEEAKKLAGDIADDILSDVAYEPVKRELGERAIQRVKRRCAEVAVLVKNQIAASDFKPELLEKAFPSKEGRELVKSAKEEEFPPLKTVSLGDVTLKGFIDRVDLLKENGTLLASALDYKTGTAAVESKDLYIGKKIQLPLYLAVLKNSGYDPVAALYYSLSDNVKKDDQLLYGPKLLDTPAPNKKAIVERLDHGISGDKSRYTGVKIEKGALKEKMLLPKEVFEAQTTYAVEVATTAVDEIEKGYIFPTASPAGNGSFCDYCSAKAICRNAKKYNRKAIKSADAGSIANVMRIVEEERKAKEQTDEE